MSPPTHEPPGVETSGQSEAGAGRLAYTLRPATAAVGPDRADTVFRVQKVLHPDVGGEHGLAQDLNTAHERAAFHRRAAS